MGRLKLFYIAAILTIITVHAQSQTRKLTISYEFSDKTFNVALDSSILVPQPDSLSTEYIGSCYEKLVTEAAIAPIIDTLLNYKEANQLNDWLYYQLVRRTAQAISPKQNSYERYTFYKWFLMVKSGFDARLTISDKRLVFFVYNNENISDIPSINIGGRKYMCLNYHDYSNTDFTRVSSDYMIGLPTAKGAFSYKVTCMPNFKPSAYTDKRLSFQYGQKSYHFDIKVNQELEAIFKNYPGVDFEYYFNIPLTKETYSSLIPMLKSNVKGMSQKKGVDYLMKFTRHALLYEDDTRQFGKEKRLSPEQTLFSSASDCDDRVALFFYLVKEIYDLPMIAMLYPTHITMAVQFDKPQGQPVIYKDKLYTVCEPTPQRKELKLGKLAAKYRNTPFQVVYAYEPSNKKAGAM
ncbi:hypothetical protein [Pedobacter deserti]|uniref:hypothetical protein n=1 Tax=Pedobacter deserti TaxID=2817382 RepID=UPI00210AD209|nr:hypothetical protein [Pedobacter sp. SYSU D00382]